MKTAAVTAYLPYVWIALLAAVVVWYGGTSGWWESGAAAGDEAPEFVLEDFHGEPVRLQDYRGERVIVNFWATWCPPCIDEMPALQAIHDEGLAVVLGVNRGETRQQAEPFIQDLHISYPVLFDRHETVFERKYRARNMPTTLFLDEEGVICARLPGAPPDPETFFRRVLADMDDNCPVELDLTSGLAGF